MLYASHSTQPTTMEFDPYQVLDIPANTTDASIITKAYRKKALQLHPDKTTLPAEQAATLFQQVQQARAFLLDDEFQQQRLDIFCSFMSSMIFAPVPFRLFLLVSIVLDN